MAISAVQTWILTALGEVPTKVLIFRFCFRALNNWATYCHQHRPSEITIQYRFHPLYGQSFQTVRLYHVHEEACYVVRRAHGTRSSGTTQRRMVSGRAVSRRWRSTRKRFFRRFWTCMSRRAVRRLGKIADAEYSLLSRNGASSAKSCVRSTAPPERSVSVQSRAASSRPARTVRFTLSRNVDIFDMWSAGAGRAALCRFLQL
jgi:hypothetical protein